MTLNVAGLPEWMGIVPPPPPTPANSVIVLVCACPMLCVSKNNPKTAALSLQGPLFPAASAGPSLTPSISRKGVAHERHSLMARKNRLVRFEQNFLQYGLQFSTWLTHSTITKSNTNHLFELKISDFLVQFDLSQAMTKNFPIDFSMTMHQKESHDQALAFFQPPEIHNFQSLN